MEAYDMKTDMVLESDTILKIINRQVKEKGHRKRLPESAIMKYYKNGWIAEIAWVAGFMTRKGRDDIARAIPDEAFLDLNQCRQADLSDSDLRTVTEIFLEGSTGAVVSEPIITDRF
jgi:hypothetical protein